MKRSIKKIILAGLMALIFTQPVASANEPNCSLLSVLKAGVAAYVVIGTVVIGGAYVYGRYVVSQDSVWCRNCCSYQPRGGGHRCHGGMRSIDN